MNGLQFTLLTPLLLTDGLFYGTQNDATIIKQVLQDTGHEFLLRRNEIFLVDRGFRDAVNYCTEEGYVELVPALKGKKVQRTTEEVNMSRRVTKIRWVVEVRHESNSLREEVENRGWSRKRHL